MVHKFHVQRGTWDRTWLCKSKTDVQWRTILHRRSAYCSGGWSKNILFIWLCVPCPSSEPLQMLRPIPKHSLALSCLPTIRTFFSSQPLSDFHFDTHHFVQRLEREGLNRAQAEGIMSAMAEVIDESIRNMTSNMVTKAEQEKVSFASTPPVFNLQCPT